MEFAGRWFTSFGPMILQQDGRQVRGTYGANGTENVLEGSVTDEALAFRYQEAVEKGTGWFRLKRPGCFAGEYLAEGHPHALPWQGWREFEGYWETTLGRMRLFQDADRVHGFLEFDGAGRLDGRIEHGRLAYTFKGSQHLEQRISRPRPAVSRPHRGMAGRRPIRCMPGTAGVRWRGRD